MTRTPYNHHQKAGNQGDVIKHVALIAALERVLESFQGRPFTYADTFAGYAHNPLTTRNEWARGIGKLFGRPELNSNTHTALYAQWYLSRPQLLGGTYPGSALIASDVCALKGKSALMFLWDTNQACVDDLRKAFEGQNHKIFLEEAKPEQDEVKSAAFLFIDPPNLKEHWERVFGFLRSCSHPLIVWLPVLAAVSKRRVREDSRSNKARYEALKLGYKVTKVRWARGGRTIGCQLIYRLPDDSSEAMQRAIAHVASILRWEVSHEAL